MAFPCSYNLLSLSSELRDKLGLLTPVAIESGVYIKRDDLFSLDNYGVIRGAKLRQCLLMLDGLTVREIITAGSIHSPQLAIVAYVARLLRRNCTIIIGGQQETVSMILARTFGAKFITCSSGRHTVLFAKAKNVAKEGSFIIPFGMRPQRLCDEFYEVCGSQVRNIPHAIETIVVAAGSGVTATSIGYGLWKERRKTKIATINVGPDRRAQILRDLHQLNPASAAWVDENDIIRIFPLAQNPKFRYESAINFALGGIPLHPIYEGKAFSWYFKNIKFPEAKTLFWLTGPPLTLQG
jgi:1-aminocyclopropane-1-carboxylate deaminase/D-cysteine desulfhydrase-like pyridoxal-dependent ACC family enzyme